MIILVLLVILGYTYFGGPKVPKILKDYKEMLLGIFVGILLHQFFGVRIEGVRIENIERLSDDPNMDIIDFADYVPPSDADGKYGDYDSLSGWSAAAVQNIKGRYENYNPRSDGGEVFGATDGGQYAGGGKKYTCGDGTGVEHQMVAVPINNNKVVQMCFKKDDPFNFTDTEAIHIQNPYHDSLDGPDSWGERHWGGKKIVSCEAVSSTTDQNPRAQMLSLESDDGTLSFYCQ